MSISHSQAVRDAMAAAVQTAIDGGTGAILRIRTATPSTIVDIALATTAFTLATNVLTLDVTTTREGTASLAGTNTATNFVILDQDGGNVVLKGTCGAGSGDLSLSTTSITQNDVVRLTGGTITYNDNGAAVPS